MWPPPQQDTGYSRPPCLLGDSASHFAGLVAEGGSQIKTLSCSWSCLVRFIVTFSIQDISGKLSVALSCLGLKRK